MGCGVGDPPNAKTIKKKKKKKKKVFNIPIKTGEFTAAHDKLQSICLEHTDKKIIFVFVVIDSVAYYSQRTTIPCMLYSWTRKENFSTRGGLCWQLSCRCIGT